MYKPKIKEIDSSKIRILVSICRNKLKKEEKIIKILII